MNSTRNIASLGILALAAIFSLAGCKNQPPAASSTQSSQQPSASQPSAPQASTPAGGAAGSEAQSAAPGSAAPAAPATPPPPAVVVLPAGTRLRVRLDQDLGSKISQPGDSFPATVADDVVVNGTVVIPHGSRAEGTVIDAKPLGRFKGGALLSIRLERVHTRWGSYPVQTSSLDRAEKGKGKRSTGFIGGGAAFGAIIGGLAGGGKGAAIGTLAGGGAGTAGSAFTGNKQIVLPAETLLTFRLEHGVHITEGQPDSGPRLQPPAQ